MFYDDPTIIDPGRARRSAVLRVGDGRRLQGILVVSVERASGQPGRVPQRHAGLRRPPQSERQHDGQRALEQVLQARRDRQGRALQDVRAQVGRSRAQEVSQGDLIQHNSVTY